MANNISRRLCVLTFGMLLFLTLPSYGTNFNFIFNNPIGVLGTSQAYTQSGVTITAFGSTLGLPVNLFGKDFGGDEVGLGIAGHTSDEINVGDLVQLDMTQYWAQHPANVQIGMGSTSWPDEWALYGSNVLGIPGVLLQTGGTDYPTLSTLNPLAKNYAFLGATAVSGDVLLSSISNTGTINVPEPGTTLLLGSLLLLVALRRKKLAAA